MRTRALASVVRSVVLAFGVAWPAPALAADCYVDSVNGQDTNDGKSATTPVKTQAAIPSGCATVRYARGSQFIEQLRIVNGVKTYTNYTPTGGPAGAPLPDFKFVTAPVVQALSGGITLDGLKLEGSHNQGGTLNSLQTGGGICVYVGNNTTVQNCEVTDCDFGIFFAGGVSGSNTKSLATHNYVHDILGEAVDGQQGIDPNAVGGSKGIYVMTNNVEVSYNTIVNCVNYPQWTGANGSSKGGCDGGATEIAVQSGGTVSGYKNHHNFAYNTCGFFQASTYFANNSGTAAQLGTFSDSEFSYNVMVDTAWMILAQVNNTNFVNMRWYNNTVVQHKNSAGPVADQGMLMEMWNGTSSGVSTGGTTPVNQIFMTNNLMVLEGVNDTYDFNASWSGGSMAANTNIVGTTNVLLNNTTLNPGFIKLGDGLTVPNPTDFDLTSDTIALGGNNPTLSGGTPISGQTLDFLNRPVPSAASGKTDIGAFQFDSVPADGGVPVPIPADAGIPALGGSSGGGSGAGSGGQSGLAGQTGRTGSGGGSGTAGTVVGGTGGAQGSGGSAGTGGTAGEGGTIGSPSGKGTGGAVAAVGTMTGGCSCGLTSRNGSRPTLALTALMIVAAARRRARRPDEQRAP